MEMTKANKIKLINTIIVSVLALSFLIATIVYVNFVKKEKENENPITNNNSNVCKDEQIRLLNSEEKFSISSQKGKIVIINFWSVNCSPCIKEMIHFENIANEYKDEVSVIAIHSNKMGQADDKLINDKIENFGWTDYTTKMGVDQAEQSFFEYLGGKDTLPFTVILDKNSEMIKKIFGSTTQEELKKEIEALLIK